MSLAPQAIRPGGLRGAYEARVRRWVAEGVIRSLWGRDVGLWTSDPRVGALIADRLGWLEGPSWLLGRAEEIEAFASGVRGRGWETVCLLGMGGSSLAPEICAAILGVQPGWPPFLVLDSTNPATVAVAAQRCIPDRTLFCVSSKSGRTIETLTQYRHFRERVAGRRGASAGEQFVAITDAGSPLHRLAEEEGFARIFLNPPDIGGRYSALSYFGMVPAALMGTSIAALAKRAVEATGILSRDEPPGSNPALHLAALLGEAALAGVDKMTLLVPGRLRPLGFWIEQLIAESTGKDGRGIVPVEGEPIGAAESYGEDRVFVSLSLRGEQDGEAARLLEDLRRREAPLVEIPLTEAGDLAGEFLRWEVATALVGAALGINPFDEPNVQESKDNTARILEALERTGSLPQGEARLAEGGIALYVDDRLWGEIASPTLAGALAGLLRRAVPGQYIALLTFIPRAPESEEALARMRGLLRGALRVPVLQGYGPRYLHSIGQLYKGGPPEGIFLEVTATEGTDVPIPGGRLTFSQLEAAQALGDLQSLQARGNPAVRLHGGMGVEGGLKAIERALGAALERLRAGERARKV